MPRKTRSASRAPLDPPAIHPAHPHEGSGGDGCKDSPLPARRLIKPTVRAAGFIHQAGQQRALLAAKEAAAEPPSVKHSADQFDAIASPTVAPLPSEASSVDPSHPVAGPTAASSSVAKEDTAEPSSAKPSTDQFNVLASPTVTSPSIDQFGTFASSTVTSLPPEAPLANSWCPVAGQIVASSLSTTPSSTEQSGTLGSSSAVGPMCASPQVLPLAGQPTAGPSRITEVQIDPILLALSTALTLDLESTVEVDNKDAPPSQLLDNPIAGIPTGDAPEVESTPSTPTSGRRTARVNSILAACHDELDKVLMKTVAETSCSVQQVLDSWNKSHGRVITATNHWNLWPAYLAKHEEEERLRAGVPTDAPLTPSLCGQLYTTFKEANKENWQEILEVHSMLELSDSGSTTISQRNQTFNKIRRQAMSLLDAAAAKYGFEAALVMCGNTVNEDVSLAFVHTTGAANNFFETRCHADKDAIIGHLKSHVYNNVSLEIVSDTFKDAQPKELQAGAKSGNLKTGGEVPVAVCTDTDGIANEKSDVATSSKDVLNYIKDGIIRLMETAGKDVSRIKRSNFPWTSLVQILGDQGLVMRGWPASALMPGQLRTQNARAKGITTLKVHERRDIYHALENNEISITKVEGKVQRKALQESQSPILIGAAPHTESNEETAQRVYYDGSIDFDGPARLPPNNARTHIQPRKVHMSKGTADDAIVLSSEEDAGAVAKPTKKSKAKLATLKAGTLNKGKAKYVPVDDSSDDEDKFIIARTADVPPVNDDASRSLPATNSLQGEEDYQAPGPEGKRKANSIVPSHVSKKPALQPQKPDAHIDDPFSDSQCNQAAIEPSSPSPKRHVPLAPLIEIEGEEELTTSSTSSSNPPAFMLPPSADRSSGTEAHPPAVPPPVPLAPNPSQYQYPFAGGNTIANQHLPVVPPPAPLPSNAAHYHYPLSYFPYLPDMYRQDPRAIYGAHLPRDFPRDAGQFGPPTFPGTPYADPQVHLDPAQPVAGSSSAEPPSHQLDPSAKAK